MERFLWTQQAHAGVHGFSQEKLRFSEPRQGAKQTCVTEPGLNGVDMIFAIDAQAHRHRFLEVTLGFCESAQAGFLLGHFSQWTNELDLRRPEVAMKLERLLVELERGRGIVSEVLSQSRLVKGTGEQLSVGMISPADLDRLHRVAKCITQVAAHGAPVRC